MLIMIMRIKRRTGLFFFICLLVLYSCGYRLIGSKHMPFDSVMVRPVKNLTYEPLLEDHFHRALSREFTINGIKMVREGGDIDIETVITNFSLSALGAVDERIKEQTINMSVDLRIVDNGNVTEFKGMGSPIRITFESTGSISDAVANKEKAIVKISEEIAKEVMSRIVQTYVN